MLSGLTALQWPWHYSTALSQFPGQCILLFSWMTISYHFLSPQTSNTTPTLPSWLTPLNLILLRKQKQPKEKAAILLSPDLPPHKHSLHLYPCSLPSLLLQRRNGPHSPLSPALLLLPWLPFLSTTQHSTHSAPAMVMSLCHPSLPPHSWTTAICSQMGCINLISFSTRLPLLTAN